MSIIKEFEELRTATLKDSEGTNLFIEEQLVLGEVLHSMLDAKLVDSENFNECFFKSDAEGIKINGYAINETEERLQIFLVDEDTINVATSFDDLLVSERAIYEKQIKRALKFVRESYKGSIIDYMQDADPCKALAVRLNSKEGIEQFDVVEIFLVSLSGSVSRRGTETVPRTINIDNTAIKVRVPGGKHGETKEILVQQKVVDLNFLHAVTISRGNRSPLEIDFQRDFSTKIEVLQAAEEKNFKSYLCVLNGELLYHLYRMHSSRLLEKNVRSFLQFQGANKGIRDTIRSEPEKFIAYNNGLTITATGSKTSTSKKLLYIDSLTDFQIVNGGQTTASIYFSKKDGIDVSKIRVMAKINVVTSENENDLEDLISSISKYSNTQSRVSNVDLKSRSPELVKIKELSNSVVTPSGKKWFFERAKGEFRTSLRKAGAQRKAFERDFPSSVRFSKEQLAKYYVAWGSQPYLVKKGGEKVFRDFLETITNQDDQQAVVIDRAFYEDTISKIILFRTMEKIYGQGKNAIGQIRSAAIPYAISAIYSMFDGDDEKKKFNLSLIWKNEGLNEDLTIFIRDLLELMNELIKSYSMSDDYGEYSKKPELWSAISNSVELENFFSRADSMTIKKKYQAKN